MVQLTIEHALSSSSSAINRNSNFSTQITRQFKAIKHHFARMGEGSENIAPFPWKVSAGERVTILGSFSVPIKNEFFVVYPNFTMSKSVIMPQVEGEIKAHTPFIKQVALNT